MERVHTEMVGGDEDNTPRLHGGAEGFGHRVAKTTHRLNSSGTAAIIAAFVALGSTSALAQVPASTVKP